MELHHYGFATKSLEQSLKAYRSLGYEKISEIITDPVQDVKLQFLQLRGLPMIELVEPLSEQSPVTKILDKNGCILYHSCYEVNDIYIKIKELRKEGFLIVVKPVQAVAFNRLIAFLYNPAAGLIELLQK
jgi:methylmalonyl-CoA/ethylmalonyl-CoA epimerase